MSIEPSITSPPRMVIRLARLRQYLSLSHSQQAEIIKKLVELKLLTAPFNPCGGVGAAKVVFADEIAKLQEIGVEKAIRQAKQKIIHQRKKGKDKKKMTAPSGC
jgi:hypothetical protein